MKRYPVLIAMLAIVGFVSIANAAEPCVAYGDEETDFTWRLCPDGVKYERQYLYFGIWSQFYRVKPDAGACAWSVARSSWMCPDRIIRCNASLCGSR